MFWEKTHQLRWLIWFFDGEVRLEDIGVVPPGMQPLCVTFNYLDREKLMAWSGLLRCSNHFYCFFFFRMEVLMPLAICISFVDLIDVLNFSL